MKIEGQFSFGGISPLAVWGFLTDANRIAQCLPGCEKLEQTGEGTYDLQMRFGVGAISGIFSGSIRLHDLHFFPACPLRYVMVPLILFFQRSIFFCENRALTSRLLNKAFVRCCISIISRSRH